MNKTKHPIWVTICAVTVSLCLIAAAVSVAFPGVTESLFSETMTWSRPFLSFWGEIHRKTEEGKEYFVTRSALQEENAALKKEVAELRQAAQAGTLTQRENDRLRALLDFDPIQHGLTLTPAWLLERTGTRLILDRGTEAGIQVEQCVLDETGAVLGRVHMVGKDWALVCLLGDGECRLTGRGLFSDAVGTVEGLTLTGLTPAHSPAVGETIVTSSRNYPSGLTIGTVTGVQEDPGGLTCTATFSPAGACGTEVFVVTGEKEAD